MSSTSSSENKVVVASEKTNHRTVSHHAWSIFVILLVLVIGALVIGLLQPGPGLGISKYARHTFKNSGSTYSVEVARQAKDVTRNGNTYLEGVTPDGAQKAIFMVVQSAAPSLKDCAILGAHWKPAFSFTANGFPEAPACSLNDTAYSAVVSKGASQYLLSLKVTGSGKISPDTAKAILSSFTIKAGNTTANLKLPPK